MAETTSVPSAASTSNTLSSAAAGLEKLLNLAVTGYTAVQTAKANAEVAKANAAASGINGVPPADAGGLLSGKNLAIAGGAVGLGILGLVLAKD